MTDETSVKQVIINSYIELLKKFDRLPTNADFVQVGIDRNKIKSQFGNLTKLHEYFKENHRETLDQYVGHEDYIFNEKRLSALTDGLATTKVFVITTAVSNKSVDLNLLATIKSYLDKRNGKLIIVASEDIASRRATNWGFSIDKSLKDEFFVSKEFRLNSNLFVSDIKVSAKQILPTTGLGRIGQTNGSYVFASPKQMLEFVATSPKEDHPKAIMTTGAITLPEYSRDKWMSQRTSYIAENDHVMGGLIVEIVDDRFFHFRHFQANSKGEFVDLGVRYYPNGEISKEVTHLYAGDWHSGQSDPDAVNATLELCDELNVENFIVGDFFDGYSISHHHVNLPLKMAQKTWKNMNVLHEELYWGGSDINEIHQHIQGDIVMVRGNHDEVLERYLLAGNYTKDYTNQHTALDLAKMLIEGKDVLQEAYRIHGEIKQFDRIVWLGRDDQFKIGNVECGQHGDLGSNGSKGTLGSLEKAYGNCIVGHTHSAAIMRGVFRVGTLTKLSLEYNRGPSSWTHTNCLIYEDGSRQLINVINGETHASYK